jgi:hypothetical protein
MDQAVYLWNQLPNKATELLPIELFTKSLVGDYSHLTNLHAFGCPCYVLDPVLQDGKKLPKWVPRTRHGQYLGVSREHTCTIGHNRNARTGHISPQFHVVYDDLFTMVPNVDDPVLPAHKEVNLDTLLWTSGVRNFYVDEEIDEHGNVLTLPALHEDYLTPTEWDLRCCQPLYHPLGGVRAPVQPPQRGGPDYNVMIIVRSY